MPDLDQRIAKLMSDHEQLLASVHRVNNLVMTMKGEIIALADRLEAMAADFEARLAELRRIGGDE